MNECLTCKEMGYLDCNWVCGSEKENEMMQAYKEHLRRVHGIRKINPEMVEMIEKILHKKHG